MPAWTQNGQRVYYRGDAANLPGFCTITAQHPSKWGDAVTVTFDDGREVDICAGDILPTQDPGTGAGFWFIVEPSGVIYAPSMAGAAAVTLSLLQSWSFPASPTMINVGAED